MTSSDSRNTETESRQVVRKEIMGCSEHREAETSFEEIELRSNVKALEFHRYTSEVLDLYVRKYSKGEIISQTQLEHVLKMLGLPEWNSPNPAISNFYKSIMTEKPQDDNPTTTDSRKREQFYFQRRVLIVACVLLGESTCKTKADLLFETFDDDASGNLEFSEFDTMWEVLKSLSIQHLPRMLQDPGQAVGLYLSRLPYGEKAAKKKIKERLFGNAENISMRHFRYIVTRKKLKVLIDPNQLRTYIAKKYKESNEKAPIKLGKFWSGLKREEPEED